MKNLKLTPENAKQVKAMFDFLLDLIPAEKLATEAKQFFRSSLARLLGETPKF